MVFWGKKPEMLSNSSAGGIELKALNLEASCRSSDTRWLVLADVQTQGGDIDMCE